ncbi:MAG: VRR-NUC domain-containing protein [Oscillospiraceae bacterium]|nr:VRR-NUC domain-containing protein [Oscillospiraceae bacterium]
MPKKREVGAALEFYGLASGKLKAEDLRYLGKPPAKRKQHEAGEQAALFAWARTLENKYPALRLMFHIPNGGTRKGGAIEGARLKAQGVKGGIPDIFLASPCGPYHGLFVELKAEKGRLQDSQKWWIEQLDAQGFRAVVCFGFDEARTEIERYLSMAESV